MIWIFFILFYNVPVLCDNFSVINLPVEHLPYYFSTYSDISKNCAEDPDCPYKEHLNKNKCWGYEHQCTWDKQYSTPACPGDHKGWVKTKFDQQSTFYTQADFGFIKQQMKEMLVICEPYFPNDSSLECSEHLRFCRGRNIMINFTDLVNRKEPLRYKMDVLKKGQIGGYCELHEERLTEHSDHMSPLQSWGPEMRSFVKLNRRPIVEGDCDVVIEKPTFVMKIDASMYANTKISTTS